jgi:hypothetical protein
MPNKNNSSRFLDFSSNGEICLVRPGALQKLGYGGGRGAGAANSKSPIDVPPAKIKEWLEAVGFNEMSVRRLLEVNPRLALMAVEAKYAFDNDPANQIKDRAGHVVGHKTFQMQANGGYRTVRDQQGPTSAGNSNANANKYQSHHQWGEAFDFWVYDHMNGPPAQETPLPDKASNNKYYERVADAVVNTKNARGIGVTRDDLRITLNGTPDWGHIELPEKFRKEWYRHPATGLVYKHGEKQPGTWIDPELHPNAGPTYAPPKPKHGAKPKK